MNSLTRSLALGAVLVGFAHVTQAIPMLRLFDGTTAITISDNLLGDVQGAAGQVVYVGSIGNWTLNVHTGTTYPVMGTLANPYLDLSFNATSSGAGGTLQISFSADGFGPTAGNVTAAIGGTTSSNGSVLYTTYGGTNNTNFSAVNLLTTQGPYSGMSFSNTLAGGVVNNAGPYSLTQVVSITHGAGAAQSTGDVLLVVRGVPDSGSTLLLLGAAVSLLGLVSRLRRRA